VLDELAAWFINTVIGSAGLTKKLEVEYLFPVVSDTDGIELSATLHHRNEKEAVIEALLFNSLGKLCTKALVTYLVFPEEVAKRKFNYPGKDAFFADLKPNKA
jgi:acyl-coenzyme A thioesterase PaaI-like protein